MRPEVVEHFRVLTDDGRSRNGFHRAPDPLDQLPEFAPGPEAATLVHTWQPIDLVALDDAPPPEPTIGGVSYPGCLALWYGEPESVKTWANLILCLEEIRKGNNVVWIDLEMGAPNLLARLRLLGGSDDELASFVYIAPSEPIGEPTINADVYALIETRRPSLCVIDAMLGALSLHQLEENSGADIEKFYRCLTQPLRAHGAAAHVIDHVTKDKDTRGRWAIGSQRKLGGVDVGISIEMIRPFGRGSTGLAHLHTRKDRHGALPRPRAAELELHSDPDTGRITWELRTAEEQADQTGTSWRPTTLMERVQTFLRLQNEPVSRNAIVLGVVGKREYVLQAIDFLILDGLVRETKGPRSSKLVEITRD